MDDKKGDVASEEKLKAAAAELEKAEKELKGDDVDGGKLSDAELLEKAAKEAEEALEKGEGDLKVDDVDAELLEKAAKEAEEALEKGKDEFDLSGDEALIEASAAYAALEKSVGDGMDSLDTKFDLLHKSVTGLTGLCIAQSKVIAALSKSVKTIVDTDGGKPFGQSKTQLGKGGDNQEELTKSTSEVRALLEKAVEADKVDPRYLSIFAVHGIAGLSEDVQEKIGL